MIIVECSFIVGFLVFFGGDEARGWGWVPLLLFCHVIVVTLAQFLA